MAKKLDVIKIQVKNKNYCWLSPIGDIHIGNQNFNEKLLDYVLKWINENEDVYVLGMGDYIDLATKKSVGTFDQEFFATKQYKMIKKKLKPIADAGRLLGLLEGNHERRITDLSGLDITQLLAEDLGVEFYGKGILLRFIINNSHNKQSYIMYSTHGTSSASTRSGKINACLKLSNIADADIYAMGHVHTLDQSKIDRFVVEYNHAILRPRHFIITGSFLNYWGSYAQSKNYTPSGNLGSPKIKFHTDEHRISVHI